MTSKTYYYMHKYNEQFAAAAHTQKTCTKVHYTKNIHITKILQGSEKKRTAIKASMQKNYGTMPGRERV